MYKKARYLLLLAMLFFCCNLHAQFQRKVTKVGGKIYHLSLDSVGFNLIVAQKRVITLKNQYSEFKLIDFNSDGYMDIYLEVGGTNTPAIFDILEYAPAERMFRLIKNIRQFPDPKPLQRSGYYYSYHRNGCADECWESDMFYIKNFVATRVANIDCELGARVGDGAISIYKVANGKRILIEKLPVINFNPIDNKWKFIRKYWFKNYKHFIPNSPS